jgi:Major Facilitator Superfamily
VVWAVVWFIWFRNTPREKRGVTSSELNEIGDAPERHEHGLPWGVAVRSGNFWAILLMGLSFGYGNYFFLAWLPTYLVRARNSSITNVTAFFHFLSSRCLKLSLALGCLEVIFLHPHNRDVSYKSV